MRIRLSSARSLFVRLAGLSLAVIAAITSNSTAPPANAQGRGGAATVIVNVVATDGGPINQSAQVTLSASGLGSGATQMTGSNGMADFERVPRGEYQIMVHADGFKDGTGEVEVPGTLGTYESTVTMQRDVPADTKEAKGTVLAPKAQKELDAGVQAMRQGHYDEAKVHLEAARKLAPGDPGVNERLGELYLFENDIAQALDYLFPSIPRTKTR
jgi:hypothetical protein